MQPMNVLVIDGQGGGLGKQLVAALSTQCPEARLTAVGTNSLAANAMRKAGAPRAATGENAVVVNCRSADIIVGPIGIVVADALLGEITPAMATAVCEPCDAGAHPGEPLRKLYRGCAGAAYQRSGGRCGAEGESSLRRGRLRKKGLLKMPPLALWASSAEKYLIIEQQRTACGLSAVAFSRKGSKRET